MATTTRRVTPSNNYGMHEEARYEYAQSGQDPTVLLIRVWLLRLLEKMPLTNDVLENSRIRKLLTTYLPELNDDDFEAPQSYARISGALRSAEELLEKSRQQHLPMWQNQEFIMTKLGTTACEAEVFLFLCLLGQFKELEYLSEFGGERFHIRELPRFLSTMLQYPTKDIAYALSPSSTIVSAKLVESAIFAHDPLDTFEVRHDIANKFLVELLTVNHLLGAMVTEAPSSSLSAADFDHLEQQLLVLQRYLKSVIKERSPGVNILIHGLPGTGKTEFSYLLAELVQTKLFAVAIHDQNGHAYRGRDRLDMLELANKAMQHRSCILLFDEAEDAFASTPFEQSAAARSKAWTNKLLETNALPTIWISNDSRCIDNAMIRRFDLVVEFKPLSLKQREANFAKVVRHKTSHAFLKALAQHKPLQIANVTRAHKVADRVHPRSQKQYESLLLNLVNATLHAQSMGPVSLKSTPQKGDHFDLQLVNTNMDLGKVCAGVKKHPNVRICLYGAPGTGKTLFAHYLGKQLKRPVLEVHGSDILSKYVGENEQKLAAAFARAKAMNAILVMDEIDTFLPSRTDVGGQWQSNLVNEMLVQLENFEGTFLASTNLIEQLDEAALRRFDIKLEFKPLGKAQIEPLITALCQELLPNVTAAELAEIATEAQHIEGLTPGDGLVIKRQARFQPIVDGADLLARLRHEVALKPSVTSKGRIGF